jgi:hypothetical protein
MQFECGEYVVLSPEVTTSFVKQDDSPQKPHVLDILSSSF